MPANERDEMAKNKIIKVAGTTEKGECEICDPKVQTEVIHSNASGVNSVFCVKHFVYFARKLNKKVEEPKPK